MMFGFVGIGGFPRESKGSSGAHEESNGDE